MKITVERLRKLRACEYQVAKFAELFPDGVVVTKELCVKHAQDFDWHWAAVRLLSFHALAAYDKAITPARADYEKVIAPAWVDYKKAVAPAWARYEKAAAPARADYEKVIEPAREEY